jgi:septum formation protein
MKQIILASASPRRKALLQQIGLPCKVVPSNIIEKLNPRLKPRGQVEQLALEKAMSIAEKYPQSIIIAADTVVVMRDEIIGKPISREDAKRILEKLSGKSHTVITGFSIIDTQLHRKVTKSIESTVFMKKLTKKDIEKYIDTNEPMDKAGGYGIQEKGGVFIERIEGDYFNVVGLPISALIEELKRFGVTIF